MRAAPFCLLLLTGLQSAAQAFSLPSWSDLFSSLKPFKDPSAPPAYVPLSSGKEFTKDDLEEYKLSLADQGSPRFGIVQLGSSGTSYNVTLNLTGHILMGLGIATSLLLYMFLNGMDNAGYGYGHHSSGYNSYDRALRIKRSDPLLTGGELASSDQVEDILSAFERQLEAAVEKTSSEGSNSIIDHSDCYTRMACHLVQNPFWSPEWRRLLYLILQSSSSDALETEKGLRERVERYRKSIDFGSRVNQNCGIRYPLCNIADIENTRLN